MNDQGHAYGPGPTDDDIELAVYDVAELMRLVLRAVAAEKPAGTLDRLAEHLRHYADPRHSNLPLERILPAAVSRLRGVDEEISAHGSLIESTFPALAYLAEVTSDDATQHLRVAKARGDYEASVTGIAARNEARRTMRDLRSK